MKPLGLLLDHIKCFGILEEIVSLLCLGADKAVAHVSRIRRLVYEHGKLFAALYHDAIKPKFHHLYHIPDNMEFLQKLLSCFVCERKHKEVNDIARFKFNRLKKSSIVDMVNRLCTRAQRDSLYRRQYLVGGQKSKVDGRLNVAVAVVSPIGELHRGDVLFTKGSLLGEVSSFWCMNDEPQIFAEIQLWSCALCDIAVCSQRVLAPLLCMLKCEQ